MERSQEPGGRTFGVRGPARLSSSATAHTQHAELPPPSLGEREEGRGSVMGRVIRGRTVRIRGADSPSQARQPPSQPASPSVNTMAEMFDVTRIEEGSRTYLHTRATNEALHVRPFRRCEQVAWRPQRVRGNRV